MWLRFGPMLARRLALMISLLLLGASTILRPATVSGQGNNPRFVDKNGIPLAGVTVRVLCYATSSTGPALADLWVTTGMDGRPVQPVPANCNYVAALQRLHEQPSGKPGHSPAYAVYAASWPPGSSTRLAVTGDVTIRDNWLLVLFTVVVSLDWEPAPGSPFPSDVWDGLRSASAYLYDLTEGQMAFGPVVISTGGHNWDGADLRFLAANDYRPTALVGGLVAASTPSTAPMTGAETVYVPGEISLGRYWNGADASNPTTGRWSQPNAWRTLVHEWGHYALFLYDEYQQSSGSETYCTCIDLPNVGGTPGACGGVSPDLAASAMAYHYTASKLWLNGTPSVCLSTDQWIVRGEQDWQTLKNWASIQGLTNNWLALPTSLTSGPGLGLAGDLFGRQPGFQILLPLVSRGGTPAPIVSEPTVNLTLSSAQTSTLVLNALYPQVYLVEGAATTTRIVYQGTTSGSRPTLSDLGQIALLDVHNGDRARVFVDRYTISGVTGARYNYAGSSPLTNNQTLPVTPNTWGASLDFDYEMIGPRVTTMTVLLTSPQSLGTSPTSQLCTPAADFACPNSATWRKTMTLGASNTWTATFTASPGTELPHRGIVYVQAGGTGELIRWFQTAGGVGPAHNFGEAPLRDGLVMVDTVSPTVVSGERNQVVFMPAASYDAVSATLPSGIEGILGSPLDVDILLPGGVSGPGDHLLPVPVTLTLFYSQEAVDRLGIKKSQLRVLHFSRRFGSWIIVPTSGSSSVLNWLATLPVVQEDGIFAVGWAP